MVASHAGVFRGAPLKTPAWEASLMVDDTLINSSNWQCFRIKVLCLVPHRNTQKVMCRILVAGKRLNLGVRGPGEKPSLGETRSSGTGGSHPGQES